MFGTSLGVFGTSRRVVGGSLRVINVCWFTACVWWQLITALEELASIEIGGEGIGLLALKGRGVADVTPKVAHPD